MSVKLITAPATEPVSLAEAKAHLRVTSSDDDDLITALIVTARGAAEHELQRSLITQTWEKALDMFPEAIQLLCPPVQSVTSVKYLDVDGVEQTLSSASYTLDNASDSTPAWLTPAYGYTWPETYEEVNAVKVRYAAGWASASSVPQPIKQWMKLQIGHWYENRESVNVGNITSKLDYVSFLLDRYRIWSL
jgi:uncharacterized phiE125 gp8 family phage protein